MGSSILLIFAGFGIKLGLEIIYGSPVVSVIRYSTLGAVVMMSRPNSRSNRSLMISHANRKIGHTWGVADK